MLSFTKMHGLGNDFIVIDTTQHLISLDSARIRALSRRDTGIGFDQCLLVEKSTLPDIDFFYRIFNANGQEVGQCGNGARCVARFIQHKCLSTKTTLRVKTNTTTLLLTLHDDHSVTVAFDTPSFNPAEIPIAASEKSSLYYVQANNQQYDFHAINVGNPHAVLMVDDVANADVAGIGALLSTHDFFPQHTNVGFVEIISPEHIKLRVYERGCAETQACGSGAVAAMAVGKVFHQLASDVIVSLPGGDLMISWPNESSSIFLRGPATFVYEGHLLGDN